jgi:hypothetical protein
MGTLIPRHPIMLIHTASVAPKISVNYESNRQGTMLKHGARDVPDVTARKKSVVKVLRKLEAVLGNGARIA